MTESESTLRQRIPHPIFCRHPFEAVTINRGALSDDPAIQAIIAEELNVVGQRLGRSFPNTLKGLLVLMADIDPAVDGD
jgi:hypothetical protein